MSIGFRVYMKRVLPPKGLVDAFRALPASNVADCMGRISAMSAEIRLMSKPFADSVAGAALTVKARPGDNLMLHKALNMAGEGDFIVVSNGGDRSQSLMGEIMASYARSKNVAGIVIDGPIRDVGALRELDIPVYATGSTPGGPFRKGPGEVNVPVACGGIHVTPGDIILADSDGVIVIPRNDAAALLEEARKFSANDQAKLAAAKAGTQDRSFVDKILAESGCEIIQSVYPG